MCLSSIEKPSGSTKCRRHPVLAASRITLPVLGGISGSTRTILNMVADWVRRRLRWLGGVAEEAESVQQVILGGGGARQHHGGDMCGTGIPQGLRRRKHRGAAGHHVIYQHHASALH